MNPRSRAWCFTINNYSDKDDVNIDQLKSKVKYMIYGKEIGELGTPHYQGYIYLKHQKTFTAMKKLLEGAHLEVAKSTPINNINYCKKEGDYIEFGEPPQQGKRTDIDKVKEVIDTHPNRPMTVLMQTDVNFQCVRLAEKYLLYTEKQRQWKPKVMWFFGKTGTGKTREAYNQSEDPYICTDDAKWWDGYDGHEDVIIDDFRADFCKFHVLLRILDRYPYRVQVKGGFRQLLAKQIIITSAYPPLEVYRRTEEDQDQLLRRIDKILEFQEKKNISVNYKNEEKQLQEKL